MSSTPPMRILTAPLLVAGLLLAIALVSNGEGGRSFEALQKATGLASSAPAPKQEAPAGHDAKSPTKAERGAREAQPKAAANQAQLQAEEKAHVMKCAKDITGDDTPRKLEPAIRTKVLECAKLFMPPVRTKELLRASAAQLVASATSPAEKADAQHLVETTTKDEAPKAENAPKAEKAPKPASK